ncbi:MAG: alpha/beta hydrolase [Ignavibacteriae bacterium]|nr:alpha/beta hydrolase [Ignavibacteriota bacterium]
METTINNLRVYLSGNEKNKSIIFIHGFPYDHTMWDEQVNFLKDKYFCVRYDIRGLGKSPAGDGQYTMDSFVEDLFSIIDELKLEKPIICGLSMGGYITFRALEIDQIKFSAAILLDTRTESDNNEGKIKRQNGIAKINKEGVISYVNNFVPTCFWDETIKNNSELYNTVLNQSRTSNAIGVKGCLFAMLSRTDTTDSLKKINIPTLILCGEFDKLTPPNVMQKIADEIPNSKFVMTKNSGHMTPIEKPDDVNLNINDFLDKIFS